MIPWSVVQVSLPMEFSRQEYWSGLPFPLPGDLSNPGIQPASPASAGDSLPLSHFGYVSFKLLVSRTSNLDGQPMKCLIKLTWKNSGGTRRRRRRRRHQPIPPVNLPETLMLKSVLTERCVHCQKGPWVRPNVGQARWLARENPETNPVTIEPETASHLG